MNVLLKAVTLLTLLSISFGLFAHGVMVEADSFSAPEGIETYSGNVSIEVSDTEVHISADAIEPIGDAQKYSGEVEIRIGTLRLAGAEILVHAKDGGMHISSEKLTVVK